MPTQVPPAVSLVLPTYNRAGMLARAISACLQDDFTDFELLIVDDGSTDETAQVLADFATQDERVRVFRQEHKGVSAARNLALSYARGEYVLFIDDDDTLLAGALTKYVERAKTQNLDILVGYFRVVSTIDGWRVTRKKKSQMLLGLPKVFSVETDWERVPLKFLGAICGNLISRSFIDEHQIRFDESLKIGEDQVFLLQCALKATRIAYINTAIEEVNRLEDHENSIASQTVFDATHIDFWAKLLTIVDQADIVTDKVALKTRIILFEIRRFAVLYESEEEYRQFTGYLRERYFAELGLTVALVNQLGSKSQIALYESIQADELPPFPLELATRHAVDNVKLRGKNRSLREKLHKEQQRLLAAEKAQAKLQKENDMLINANSALEKKLTAFNNRKIIRLLRFFKRH